MKVKPFQDYDLSRVIAKQWNAVNEKIESMSNEEVMANDLEVLAENIYQEFFIEPVTIFEEDFSKRSIKQGKIQAWRSPVFINHYGRSDVTVDGIIAKFYFPYQGDKTLFQCRASTYSMGPYPEISIDKSAISFQIERSLKEMNEPSEKDKLLNNLARDLKDIKDGISFANKDVAVFNNLLKSQSLTYLKEKKKKIESFFNIATMFEVPIEKKEYAQTHVPLKRRIVPVAKHYEESNYYGITDVDYNDILTTIKHYLSTYERTPSSYKALHEEDLRNTVLAALNATYKGEATGETFRNGGKTDICIERENRAAFVAECKMWSGQKEIGNAIDQLDGYLTWRDCKTALIYFVKRKDFMKTIESAKAALRSYGGMKNVKEVDKNEYECLFLSKSNPGQQVKLRVMLFNLYCED